MSNYLRKASLGTRHTPQSQPIPGRVMVQNDAGGYAFELDPMDRLKRFLILGSEGGTYYVSEQKLTRDNMKVVGELLRGPRANEALDLIQAISVSGRAAKNDPAILALAAACSVQNDAIRKRAIGMIPDVCRIGTHLLHFCAFVEEFRGWGRGLRRGIGDWFAKQTPDDLAFQTVKYQSRDGWSLQDALRLAHLAVKRHQPVLRWIACHEDEDISMPREVVRNLAKQPNQTRTDAYGSIAREALPKVIVGFELIHRADSAGEAARIIRDYRLPREAVPTEFLKDVQVWEALLEQMPPHAMLRNLGKMTSIGLVAPFSAGAKMVCERLADGAQLRRKRIHPISVLSALKVYCQGHGVRTMGRDNALTWTPVSTVMDALEAAFYETFTGIEPTGKSYLLAVDWSGSMASGEVAGTPALTPAEAAAVQAMVIARRERNYQMIAFATKLKEVNIGATDTIETAMAKTAIGVGEGTDCSVPMRWAMEKKISPDAIVTLTDGQTWYGQIHPAQAMEELRRRQAPECKYIEVAMTPSGTTLGDMEKPYALSVAGFDANVPAVIGEFVRGM